MTPELPSPEADVAVVTHDEKSLGAWLQVQPQSLPPAQVHPDLPQLSALERSAEVLRYSAQCAEHWLSPRGVLREWLRRNLRLAFAVVIPLLVIAPVVTLLLDKLQGWSVTTLQIATNLGHTPAITATMLVSAAGACLYRWLLR